MLDTGVNSSPDAGYKLYHASAVGIPTLTPGPWNSKTPNINVQFSPPWQSERMGDTFSVPIKDYLPEDIFNGYECRERTLTYLITLPDSLENSDTCPLFAWGRSDGAGHPSGWSFATAANYETG